MEQRRETAAGRSQTTLYLLVGIPGSGKSFWAKQMAEQGIAVHSSDAIRGELYGDERTQGNPQAVFQTLGARILADLNNGISCIYDATNGNEKLRTAFLRTVPKETRKICVLFLTPPDVCIERDRSRERTVGENVIDRYLRSFQCPDLREGFDEILPVIEDPSYTFPLADMQDFSQDNPHHRLTLGEHMIRSAEIAAKHQFSKEVQIAASVHDCGKYYTKRFENTKGEPTNVAHFYGHENYGAYLFLLDACFGEGQWKYGGLKETLYLTQLINWHMRPYQAWEQSRAAFEKDRRRFGDQMIKDLIDLHAADVKAH